ncbi:MAG: O-antigen ligase family protein [Prolixibacteraceae bacterium]
MSVKIKSKTQSPPNILYTVILLVYVLVAVFTPQMEAFDSNGPKFLSLAILNLLVFSYIFTRKEFKDNPLAVTGFFRSWAGIMYSLLILISLLSFVKSINVNESILYFCKSITVFISCYFVALLIASDKRILENLAVAMVFLLIVDCLYVYIQMVKFLKGDLPNIELITSVYSNKNVLAAAIFIKLPFALWLYSFRHGWEQKLALAGWSMSFLALLFMSSRAFYLGIILLSMAYLLILWILSNREEQKAYRRKMIIYSAVLASSVLLYTVVQKNLYTSPSIYNAGIVERLTQAKPTEYSTGERLSGWKRSFEVFKREPLLGCGIGNWKIATLKEENQTKTDLIYQYRSHNDVIQITTETGIFGGLAFLGLFVLLVLPLFKAGIVVANPNTSFKQWFLPGFGMMVYAFDAFFNFPHERPEIQVLFALFVGTGIALSQKNPETQKSAKGIPAAESKPGRLWQASEPQVKRLSIAWKGFLLVLILLSVYILILNFKSLKTQKIVSDEISSGKLNISTDQIIQDFPWLPNINLFGEPIAVQKARYLFRDKNYNGAIAMLRGENTNPYDSRREYFLASAWLAMGKTDSALFWNIRALELKPFLLENLTMICSIYEHTGKLQETAPLLQKYLDHDKNNPKAWLLMTQYLEKSGDLKKAYDYSQTACKYHSTDAAILQNRDALLKKLLAAPKN